MGKPKDEELPVDVEDLRARILDWRISRVGREHMPQEIWAEAFRLAKALGTCRVARAVGFTPHDLRRSFKTTSM